MPRYYFHVKDGHDSPDLEGTELPDLEAARRAAVTMSGELLRDGVQDSLWEGHPWEIMVTDGPDREGREYFRLCFTAKEPTPYLDSSQASSISTTSVISQRR
jgi:hypothetical protein